MSAIPAYGDLPTRGGLPASWGLWGPDGDVLGCLNMLTPERVVAAAGLVRKGAVFALNWSMGLPDPPLFGREPFRHEVTGTVDSTSHDDVLHNWNTQSSSQWDGFRHIRNHAAAHDEAGTGHFGGVDDEAHGIHHWAARGWWGERCWSMSAAGVSRVGPAVAVRPARSDRARRDRLECLAAQGTELQEGDVLLMRTGWVGLVRAADRPRARRVGRAGCTGHAQVCAAASAWPRCCGTCTSPPSGATIRPWRCGPGRGSTRRSSEAEVRADRHRLHEIFTHTLLLPMLGLPLGEMWKLEALAADCASGWPLRVHVHLGSAEPAARRRQSAQRPRDRVGTRHGTSTRPGRWH